LKKIEKVKQVLSGVGISGRGKGIGKEQRKVNIVEVLFIHLF
jgi:hypothetical protein